MVEDLKLVARIPNEVYLEPYTRFLRSLNLILAVLLFVLLAVILFVLRGNLYRLRTLTNQIKRISAGESDLSAPIRGQDEVGVLAANFYQMIGQIQENICQIQKQEKREKEIEYSLLISQIDPHFIYNTLDAISCLAQMNRYEDITVINRALTEMLRNRLNMSKLQIYDTLEKEEQQIRSYLTIQNYLCGDRISFEFQANDLQISYPKNILQPLVENAVFHGILLHRSPEGEKLPGLVRVSVRAENGGILTQIEDDGIGMSEDALHHYFSVLPKSIADFDQSSGKHTHIGIYNIRMRLSYLYGDACSILAESPGHQGLRITLWIPLRAS